MIKKNKLKITLGILFLTLLITPYYIRCICLAKISVKVVDEVGEPVDGSSVRANFTYGKLTEDAIAGQADHEGQYSVWSRTPDGEIIGSVSKTGYYSSFFSYQFFDKLFGFWRPWNQPTIVTLRPVINPVPMYVRNLDKIEVPESGKEIGYDLMESDWVKPYGKGKRSDFIFRVDQWYESPTEYALTTTLTFPNKNDGIQVVEQGATYFSRYKLPRTALEDGYQNKMVKQGVSSVKKMQFINDYKDSNNYIFRVRTEMDERGKVKRAMYGKILGELKSFFSDSKTEKAVIKMHYYLNPDYTRNLEFDPKRNLSTKLLQNEYVGEP